MTFVVQALEMFGTPETSLRHLKRSNHPLEATYAGMLRRCYNPNEPLFHRYGGRGITVCDRWRLPYGKGFANFVADLGEKPVGMSLDRINPHGNYEPNNCRWADRTTQNRNRSDSRFFPYKGVKTHICVLAELAGVTPTTIARRITWGLTPEEAVSHKTFAKFKFLKRGL